MLAQVPPDAARDNADVAAIAGLAAGLVGTLIACPET
jgi:hypothetical protein